MIITPIPNAKIPMPEDTIGNERSRHAHQVHVTDILNYMDDVLYGTKSDADFESDGWDSAALCEAGFTYERMLEMAWVDRLGVRCGEIEREDIVGSPDGVRFDPEAYHPLPSYKPWVIEEYKFSWQASDKAFVQDQAGTFLKPKWQRFINQAKSYCVLWGDGSECNRVLYRILFVCGDYKKERGAQYKEFLVEFTEQELKDWWGKMKMIRDRILEKRKQTA